MVWCLPAPNNYMNYCWLIIKGVLRVVSYEAAMNLIHNKCSETTFSKLQPHFAATNELPASRIDSLYRWYEHTKVYQYFIIRVYRQVNLEKNVVLWYHELIHVSGLIIARNFDKRFGGAGERKIKFHEIWTVILNDVILLTKRIGNHRAPKKLILLWHGELISNRRETGCLPLSKFAV